MPEALHVYRKQLFDTSFRPVRDETMVICRFSINIKSLPGLKKLNLNSLSLGNHLSSQSPRRVKWSNPVDSNCFSVSILPSVPPSFQTCQSLRFPVSPFQYFSEIYKGDHKGSPLLSVSPSFFRLSVPHLSLPGSLIIFFGATGDCGWDWGWGFSIGPLRWMIRPFRKFRNNWSPHSL